MLAEEKPTSSANSTSGRNQELGTKQVHFFPKKERFADGGEQEGSGTWGGRWREAEREGSRARCECLERKCPRSAGPPSLRSPTPRGARRSLVPTSAMPGEPGGGRGRALHPTGCGLRACRKL